MERSTIIQHMTTASAGSVCKGWASGRLGEQCLRAHTPAADERARRHGQKPREPGRCNGLGHLAVTILKTLAFFSLALLAIIFGSTYLCGRHSVRQLHACDCATDMCTMPGLDFMAHTFVAGLTRYGWPTCFHTARLRLLLRNALGSGTFNEAYARHNVQHFGIDQQYLTLWCDKDSDAEAMPERRARSRLIVSHMGVCTKPALLAQRRVYVR